jgi:hypothetical protein
VNYKVKGMSFSQMCKHNAKVAEAVGRYDLTHMWHILALLFQNGEEFFYIYIF